MPVTALIIASSLAVPLRDCDTAPCYPTAYMDQGNRDYACRSLTFSNHSGLDFGIGGFEEMDRGRPVYAAASGRIIQVEDGHFDRCSSGQCDGGDGYGNHVLIDHGNGKHSLYAHLRNGSIAVDIGDDVGCGEAIGLVGSSGFSTGAHLHFEWRLDDESIDPFAGPCGEEESAWVVQGVHGALPARLCANEAPADGEDGSRVLQEPAVGSFAIPQGREATYCWRVQNSGSRMWTPQQVNAVLVSGDRLGHQGTVNLVEAVDPGAETTLCAELTANGAVGERLRGSWRLARAGSVFGSILVVRIDVIEAVDGGGPVTDAGIDFDQWDVGTPKDAGAEDEFVTAPGCGCASTDLTSLTAFVCLLLFCRRRYRAGTVN